MRRGVTEAEAWPNLLAANDEATTLLEKIIEKYLAYCESRDFVLCRGPLVALPVDCNSRRAARRRAGPGVLGPGVRRRHGRVPTRTFK